MHLAFQGGDGYIFAANSKPLAARSLPLKLLHGCSARHPSSPSVNPGILRGGGYGRGGKCACDTLVDNLCVS